MTREQWKKKRLKTYKKVIVLSRRQSNWFAWKEVERISQPIIHIDKNKKTVKGIIEIYFKSGTTQDQEVEMEWRTKEVEKQTWFGKKKTVKIPFEHQDYFDHPTATEELDSVYKRYKKYFTKIQYQ